MTLCAPESDDSKRDVALEEPNVALTIATASLSIVSAPVARYRNQKALLRNQESPYRFKPSRHQRESVVIDSQRRFIAPSASSRNVVTVSRFFGRGYRFKSPRFRRRRGRNNPNRTVFGEKERRSIPSDDSCCTGRKSK